MGMLKLQHNMIRSIFPLAFFLSFFFGLIWLLSLSRVEIGHVYRFPAMP